MRRRRADAQNLVARNRGVDEGVATDHPELGRHLSDEAQVEALAAHRPSGDLEEEVARSVVRTFSFSMKVEGRAGHAQAGEEIELDAAS